MNLEFWREIVYLSGKVSLVTLIIISLLSVFRIRRIPSSLKPLVYYIFATFITELLVYILFNYYSFSEETYYLVNKFYGIAEIIFLGFFFYIHIHKTSLKRLSLSISTLLFLLYLFKLITAPGGNDEYLSVILSAGHLLICLILLSGLAREKPGLNFSGRPEVSVVLLLILSYTLIILIFIFMPGIVNYSRILANQIEIFRIFLGIFFYIVCYMTLRRSSHQPHLQRLNHRFRR